MPNSNKIGRFGMAKGYVVVDQNLFREVLVALASDLDANGFFLAQGAFDRRHIEARPRRGAGGRVKSPRHLSRDLRRTDRDLLQIRKPHVPRRRGGPIDHIDPFGRVGVGRIASFDQQLKVAPQDHLLFARRPDGHHQQEQHAQAQ